MTDTTSETTAPTPMPTTPATVTPLTVTPLNGRIVFALRQAALLAVALLVAGLVTERLRPDEALDRGITSTPYLWAVVLWLIVLLVNAFAFEESLTRALEGVPFYCGAGIGVLVFVIGLVSLDAGNFGRRLVYLFAVSVGAVMFWWAVASLGYLLTRRITD